MGALKQGLSDYVCVYIYMHVRSVIYLFAFMRHRDPVSLSLSLYIYIHWVCIHVYIYTCDYMCHRTEIADISHERYRKVGRTLPCASFQNQVALM